MFTEGQWWAIGGGLCAIGFIWWLVWITKKDKAAKLDAKRLSTDCPQEIKELAAHAKQSFGGLSEVCELAESTHHGDSKSVSPGVIVTLDFLAILKKLREPRSPSSSRLRTSKRQEELLRMFAARIGNEDIVRMEPWRLGGFIDGVDSKEFSGLSLLVRIDHDERYGLRDMYLAVAKLASEGSAQLLETVQEEIRAAARNPEEALEEALRSLGDLQQKQDDLLFIGHRELLEVDADFSAEQLKANYRRLVTMWHPDKLRAMAPELQQMANDRVALLNEAYAALSGSSSDERIQQVGENIT